MRRRASSDGIGIRPAINVTPLVDVVLVLLIIFMVIAPRLQAGDTVELPRTERPADHTDDDRQIEVTIDGAGALSLDGSAMTAAEFPERMRLAAQGREDWPVVIKADARLSFGEVQRAMFVIEEAGFSSVSLIARQRDGS